MRRLKKIKSGFTVVELIMATAVFSVVLLLGLTGFVQIGKMFYKGITIAQTRDVSTNILQTVTNDIKFAENILPYGSPSNPYFICVGNHRYSARVGQKLDTADGASYALKRDTFNNQGDCMNPALNPTTNDDVASSELLQNRMRISSFNITQNPAGPNLWNVSFVVAYGDDTDLDNYDQSSASCKASSVGTQFCAVSRFNTVVHRGLGDI